jgi:hypothetical protein
MLLAERNGHGRNARHLGFSIGLGEKLSVKKLDLASGDLSRYDLLQSL